MTEHHREPVEISVDSQLRSITFSENGEYLVTGGRGVELWRAEDGEHITTLTARDVRCVAVSPDGKWIAAGMAEGEVLVWDTATNEQRRVSELHTASRNSINAVDFALDSTRLVSVSGRTLIAWDIPDGRQLQVLDHEDEVIAAKYSPHGDQIATATQKSVQVWSSISGRLLVEIKVNVVSLNNNGLLWYESFLFVISDGAIKQFGSFTGSELSAWPVPDCNMFPCITLVKHGEFIAYSTRNSVTFWDTTTETPLHRIRHPHDVYSIAFSPDDRFLAIHAEGGKITIDRLPPMTVLAIQIDPLIARRFNQYKHSEGSSTAGIDESQNSHPHTGAGPASVQVDTKSSVFPSIQEVAPYSSENGAFAIAQRIIHAPHLNQVDHALIQSIIRAAVQNAIRDSPLVLINTHSGRLFDKSAQARSFEAQPIFQTLISSPATRINYARIEREVANYYRYAMFSHTWEDKEPLYENVVHIVVYDLGESFTHNKLKMFCKITQDSGIHWAWSDTCCINKVGHFVLQEALVSMFKWYEGSAVTIVLLRGVRFPPKRGALVKSFWNSRAWTLQEYHAAKVVRFYTEDWRPYVHPDIPNHKQSPEIIAEMEEATGISARALMALRPGRGDIREKLRLASTRKATRVEDAAYSLLGIFSIILPVVYGEGEQAVGRLLAQLLSSSGNTSILAWTGKAGRFNSCLPADIDVFHQPLTAHIPPFSEIGVLDIGLRASSLDSALLIQLYDRLHALPVPWFSGQRMRLPCIVFRLERLLSPRAMSGYVWRGKSPLLGFVEVRMKEDTYLPHGFLIYPWIDFLLGRHPVGQAAEMMHKENMDFDFSYSPAPAASRTWTSRLLACLHRSKRKPTENNVRPWSPLSVPQTDKEKEMAALQIIARLRQPFGALLITHAHTNIVAYRRVAADSLVTVQVGDITPESLKGLVSGITVLDVM